MMIFIMSNLSKLRICGTWQFWKELFVKGTWCWNIIYLTAKGLGDGIIEGNKASSQDKAKVMIYLRRHLDESQKVEYLTVKDPLELWIGLKGMYDHLKATVLPRARYEWMHLQFQDYKIFIEFNSSVFRIISHASNMILQHQYREKYFKKYSELI